MTVTSMSVTNPHSVTPENAPAGPARHPIVRLVQAAAEAYRLRRRLRILQELDDRLLADIGLTRTELKFIVRYASR